MLYFAAGDIVCKNVRTGRLSWILCVCTDTGGFWHENAGLPDTDVDCVGTVDSSTACETQCNQGRTIERAGSLFAVHCDRIWDLAEYKCVIKQSFGAYLCIAY